MGARAARARTLPHFIFRLSGNPYHLSNNAFPLPTIRRPLHLLHLHSVVFSGSAPWVARNDDLIARSERTAGHAILGQLRRRGPLNNPDLWLSFFLWNLNPDVGVRIAPQELF